MSDDFFPVTVSEIVDECRDVKTFRFGDDDAHFLDADPGQFAMFQIPGASANPFSLSYGLSPGITVRKLSDDDHDAESEGKTDEDGDQVKSFAYWAFQLEPGDRMLATYPKGNSFDDFIDDRMEYQCIIAGGCGAAPLAYLSETIPITNEVTVLLGAKNRNELLFEKRFREDIAKKEFDHHGRSRVLVSTDDGSLCYHGKVTDLIGQADLKKEETTFYICGPEPMMSAVAEKLVREDYAQPEDILILMERYMKCAEGLCGACSCGGLRICVDGPVFTYETLRDNSHFGSYRRRKSGLLEPI